MIALLRMLPLLAAASAPAAAHSVIAAFERAASQPMAPLVMAADGHWRTTTAAGGAFGRGTILRITAAGTLTILHSFAGPDGAAPLAGLVAGDSQEFWGTTTEGGDGGFGTVFRIAASGSLTTVTSFSGTGGPTRGAVPGELVRAADGSFWGTTAAGGAAGFGTIFRIGTTGTLETMAEFTGTTGAIRGSGPIGALTISGGSLYGVTREGGAQGLGTVYRITTAGVFSTLAEFTGVAGTRPGANPAAGLATLTDGSLCGTTEFGGTADFGTAFRFTTSGAFTLLRSFSDATGSQPAGSLLQGSDGFLYGTTAAGGSAGFGTLFRLSTAGVHTLLASFTGTSGAAPGAVPRAGAVVAGDGSLWGSASAGGPGQAGTVWRWSGTALGLAAALTTSAGWMPSGAPLADGTAGFILPLREGGSAGGGTLARLAVDDTVTAVASFSPGTASRPEGTLTRSGLQFFGTAVSGGSADRGGIFRWSAAGGLALFSAATSATGILPEGTLAIAGDGSLFGTAREGGTAARGTLYRVSPAADRLRLVSFTGTSGAARGNRPRGGIVMAVNAAWYGVTESGGSADAGTIFRLSAAGTLLTLTDFTASGPRAPLGGLTSAPDGSLFGTTSRGGSADGGTLFRLIPGADSWQVVAHFSESTGTLPAGPLAIDAAGRVHGLATSGGLGHGTLWRWSASGGLTMITAFTGIAGAAPGTASFADGGTLVTGGLALTPDGSIVGALPAGGPGGGGVIFRHRELSPLESWKLETLGSASAPDTDDPDHDGLATLAEYALLLDPATPDVASLPVTRRSSAGHLECTLLRDPARNDVTITVEAADDLSGPWSVLAASTGGTPFAGPGYVGGEDAPAGSRRAVLIRDALAAPSAPRRFIRTRFTR